MRRTNEAIEIDAGSQSDLSTLNCAYYREFYFSSDGPSSDIAWFWNFTAHTLANASSVLGFKTVQSQVSEEQLLSIQEVLTS